MNKEKLIEAVRNIPSIAKEENWVFTSDRDEGALFYSPKVIANNAELFQVTDEYAIYLDKKFVPQGVMVEYYNQNFVKHHPEFKGITKTVFGKDGQEIKTVNPNNKNNQQAIIFKSLFEKTLITDALGSSLYNGLKRTVAA